MTLSQRWVWFMAALFAVMISTGCEKKTSVEFTGGKNDRTTAESRLQKTSDKVSDAAITTKVKSAIVSEPGLKALQINVDTADGVVTLTGVVDAPQNIDRAMQVAQAVEGVKFVNNRLSVKSSG